MLPVGDKPAPNQRALTSLMSNMRTSYGLLGGTNDLSGTDTPVWNFNRIEAGPSAKGPSRCLTDPER